jgi:hypothetical protein
MSVPASSRGHNQSKPPVSAPPSHAEGDKNDPQPLVLGASPLPNVSSSDLHYPLTNLENATVLHSLEGLPEELRNLESVRWKDNAFLKETFKKPARPKGKTKASETVFPQCLIIATKTLKDRLIVINWWLSLTREEQKHHKDNLRNVYSRPTVSASPLGFRSGAIAAAKLAADERYIAPIDVPIVADSQSIKLAPASGTTSRRKIGKAPAPNKQVRQKIAGQAPTPIIQVPRKISEQEATTTNTRVRRKIGEAPTTNKQVHDRTSRRKLGVLQKAFKDVLETTSTTGEGFTAKFEAVLIVRNRYHVGRGKQTKDEVTVYGRNENEARNLIKDFPNYSDVASTWYMDDGTELPPVTKKARKSRASSTRSESAASIAD